jgi:hypothetical protein
LKSNARKGFVHAHPALRQQRAVSAVRIDAYNVTADIINRGQQCPPNNPKKSMPHSSQSELIKEIQQKIEERYEQKASYSLIKHILDKDFPDVYCSKWKPFQKCGVCETEKHTIRTTEDPAEREDAILFLEGHLDNQYTERKHYWRRASHSIAYPEKSWAILHDSMDQTTATFPHLHQPNKNYNYEVGEFVTGHTIGAICSGAPIPVIAIVNNGEQYSNDGNLVVSSLHQILMRQRKELDRFIEEDARAQEHLDSLETDVEREEFKKKRAAQLAEEMGGRERNKQWPKKLFLQFDNASNNKGQCMFHYCAWLVHWGVFESIRIGFMIPGHTHDIVDQLFSRISLYLRRVDVWTTNIHSFFTKFL